MSKSVKTGIILAILAAGLYAVNSPLSKLLLGYMTPTLMAGFLYIGAGLGMALIAFVRRVKKTEKTEARLTKAELPYTVAMVLLDIAAPICLLFGLKATTAANASLLNNFEIVATAVIALLVFKEKIGLRLWCGILFVTVSCLLLSFEDIGSLQFSFGSLFVLLACICWGFENNCTRKISSKDPLQIVLLKGVFSGMGSVVIGFCIGERITVFWSVFAVLGVGFVAYGLSIFFYVYAQRLLGAARTSAYYAVAPFIGTFLSLLIFRTLPQYMYFIALALMVVGAILCANDEPIFKKKRVKGQAYRENTAEKAEDARANTR
ncbi:MAG: DMT family transporter [Clostridia bacterium]|nr:DMT family transporter [Clostridia bacterium]